MIWLLLLSPALPCPILPHCQCLISHSQQVSRPNPNFSSSGVGKRWPAVFLNKVFLECCHTHSPRVVYCCSCATRELRSHARKHVAQKTENIIWSFTEKMFYRHCLRLACSSTRFSHEHLSRSSCSRLNVTTSSRSPFLSCAVAPIILLYHCILFSLLYFKGKYLFTGLSVPKVQGSDAFYLSIYFLYLSQSLANNKYF